VGFPVWGKLPAYLREIASLEKTTEEIKKKGWRITTFRKGAGGITPVAPSGDGATKKDINSRNWTYKGDRAGEGESEGEEGYLGRCLNGIRYNIEGRKKNRASNKVRYWRFRAGAKMWGDGKKVGAYGQERGS